MYHYSNARRAVCQGSTSVAQDSRSAGLRSRAVVSAIRGREDNEKEKRIGTDDDGFAVHSCGGYRTTGSTPAAPLVRQRSLVFQMFQRSDRTTIAQAAGVLVVLKPLRQHSAAIHLDPFPPLFPSCHSSFVRRAALAGVSGTGDHSLPRSQASAWERDAREASAFPSRSLGTRGAWERGMTQTTKRDVSRGGQTSSVSASSSCGRSSTTGIDQPGIISLEI